METQKNDLLAENLQLKQKIIALESGNRNKSRYSDDLYVLKLNHPNLAAVLEAEPDMSYDYYDRYHPEILSRLKNESPAIYQKLVDEYIAANEWLTTGHKPETHEDEQ